MPDDYGRNRERDSRPQPHRGYQNRDRKDPNDGAYRKPPGTPQDGRNRSRSPRRERGGRRSDNNRSYRSRSPNYRRNRDDKRDDRRDRRDDRDERPRGREPPTGPRGHDRKAGYTDPFEAPGGPVRPPFRDSPARGTPPASRAKKEEDEVDAKDVKMEDANAGRPADMDDETWELMKVMGFGGFKTTKETKVPGNDRNWGIRRDKKMEARQYMNRQGGFNRPLSPSRTGQT